MSQARSNEPKEAGGMRVCDHHWTLLKAAIEERGLSDLIAKDGETALRNLTAELKGQDMLANYDPLMAAHWAIVNNCMSLIAGIGGNPLYLMGGSDDPVVGYGKQYEGRTWPHCPLCYVNLAHEVTCKDRRCKLPKTTGYDFWITRAADDQAQHVKEMVGGGTA